MSKKENTLVILEAALERITKGKPKRIPDTRKLSVRAVEEEANLGNGSGYYYPKFVEKVKLVKAELAQNCGSKPRSNIDSIRDRLNDQTRIKLKYKEKKEHLKHNLSQLATGQHHLSDALRKALARINELELEKEALKETIVELKRSTISRIS